MNDPRTTWLAILIGVATAGFIIGCMIELAYVGIRALIRRRRFKRYLVELEAERAAWCAEMLARMVQES